MSSVIAAEAGLFLRSLLWGLMLGFGYEMTRWIGKALLRRKWWNGLEDLLYWSVCTVLIFVMIQKENSGIVRWYILAGMAAGAAVHHLVIRPVVHRGLRPMWITVRNSIQFVENLLKKRKKSVTLINKMEK